jgi:hypothetical protein
LSSQSPAPIGAGLEAYIGRLQLPDTLAADLLEFGYWKRRKFSLIRAGIRAGFPAARIAAMMDISPQTVYGVKKSMRSRGVIITATRVENIVESL